MPDDVVAPVETLKQHNPFDKERVETTHGYHDGWTVPAFEEQRSRTAKLFPDLALTDIAQRNIAVPNGWDSVWWFPPKVAALGYICEVPDHYFADYGKVVEHVLALIGQQRKLRNYRAGELTAEYIRINKTVRDRLLKLESATSGDFLPPMPFSFGQFYGGFSPRNARETALCGQELPLCTVQVASLLAVMPERLVSYEGLWIDVPGDEYNWNAVGHWSYSLYFSFDCNELRLSACYAVDNDEHCGSVVALPRVSGRTS